MRQKRASIKSSWRGTESSDDNGRINRANGFQVKEVLQVKNILVTNVPANMTRFYHSLDLMMNESAKYLLQRNLMAGICSKFLMN